MIERLVDAIPRHGIGIFWLPRFSCLTLVLIPETFLVSGTIYFGGLLMKMKPRALLSIPLVFSICLVPGCAQPDNPTPTAAPKPEPPKKEELALPTKGGKPFDPAANSRYKQMQENMAKQSGS